jgi:hypothetical protein
MLMAGVVPNILGFVIVLLYLPESPRYLLVWGRYEELRDTMVFIANMNGRPEKLVHRGYCQRLDDKTHRQIDDSITSGFFELITNPMNLRIQSTLVGAWCLLALCLFGQAFLLPMYFEDRALSFSGEDELMLLLTFQMIEVPGLLWLCTIIDHPAFGRRKSIAASAGFCAINALLVHFLWDKGIWVLLPLFMGVKVFGVMAFEAMYVYAAELVPTTNRQAGLSLGIGASKAACGLAGIILVSFINSKGASNVSGEIQLLYCLPITLYCPCSNLKHFGNVTSFSDTWDSSMQWTKARHILSSS